MGRFKLIYIVNYWMIKAFFEGFFIDFVDFYLYTTRVVVSGIGRPPAKPIAW